MAIPGVSGQWQDNQRSVRCERTSDTGLSFSVGTHNREVGMVPNASSPDDSLIYERAGTLVRRK